MATPHRDSNDSILHGVPGADFFDACCTAALGEGGSGPTFGFQEILDGDEPAAQLDDWPALNKVATVSKFWNQSDRAQFDEYNPIEDDYLVDAARTDLPLEQEMVRQNSNCSSSTDQAKEEARAWAREQSRKRMIALERQGDMVEGGSRYHGDWKGAHRHGRGIFTRPDGSRYEGTFHEGYAHGNGTWTEADGTRYEGQWREDRAHGKGKLIHPDGSSYEGQWRDDEKCGSGMEIANGTTYEGEFLHGLRHGNGLYTSSVDSISYGGQFRYGRMDGEGKFQFDDGRLYFGQWMDGRMDGIGTMDWPNGSRYQGSFWSGNRHGEGSLVWSDGRVYKGQWCNGKREGTGVLANRGGEKTRGEWVDGEPVHLVLLNGPLSATSDADDDLGPIMDDAPGQF